MDSSEDGTYCDLQVVGRVEGRKEVRRVGRGKGTHSRQYQSPDECNEMEETETGCHRHNH